MESQRHDAESTRAGLETKLEQATKAAKATQAKAEGLEHQKM